MMVADRLRETTVAKNRPSPEAETRLDSETKNVATQSNQIALKQKTWLNKRRSTSIWFCSSRYWVMGRARQTYETSPILGRSSVHYGENDGD